MVTLDFIYGDSSDLFGTGWERKIQNENICFQRDSNPRHATPRQDSQRSRPLGQAVFWFSILWKQMDMWQYLYGISYSLILSRVKTWQVRGIWSQQLEHKQVPQWGTEPGVLKGKRSLLACHTRCKYSMETTHNRWRSSSISRSWHWWKF